MIIEPHYAETLAYVTFCKKRDAIDILLDLETDIAWASTLCEYERWLEDETLTNTEE